MKTLYLECNMGAAGDMLMAALYEICTPEQKETFLRTMHEAGFGFLRLVPQRAVQCGIVGTHMCVQINGGEEAVHGAHSHAHTHGAHSSYADITGHLSGLHLPETVRQNAISVYRLLADAESRVHGVPVAQIHFHEVGTLDALADVTGVCLLVHLLAPDKIFASPVATGSGTVQCAHGSLPVPAPATALLLEGVPTCSGPEPCELCTPTGAALLRYFAVGFGPRPAMTMRTVGYGMGTKQFSVANCVRAFWGDALQGTADSAQSHCATAVTELCCNLDDMTAEAVAFATETLLEQGALDVYTTSIGMKKGRAATKLSVLCRTAQADMFAQLLLTHTTTLGVRATACTRYLLSRAEDGVSVETPYGPVRIKTAQGTGALAAVQKCKPEYEDVAAAARKHNVPFSAVEAAALAVWQKAGAAQDAP